MKTDVLNKYLFSEIVIEHAVRIRNSRIFKLEDQGLISHEQAQAEPLSGADIKEALLKIQHNRKAVFDILATLEAAPAEE